jgi:hypothetical protein
VAGAHVALLQRGLPMITPDANLSVVLAVALLGHDHSHCEGTVVSSRRCWARLDGVFASMCSPMRPVRCVPSPTLAEPHPRPSVRAHRARPKTGCPHPDVASYGADGVPEVRPLDAAMCGGVGRRVGCLGARCRSTTLHVSLSDLQPPPLPAAPCAGRGVSSLNANAAAPQSARWSSRSARTALITHTLRGARGSGRGAERAGRQ